MMKNKVLGFTLIEMMVVVAVVAILLSVAVPSFSGLLSRARVKAVAEEQVGHLYLAKAEALKSGKPVYYSVNAGAGQCYGFKKASACDCIETTGAKVCDLMRVGLDAKKGVVMTSSYGTSDVGVFEPIRGTVPLPGRMTLTSKAGDVLTTGLTSVGRVFVCTPSGTGNVPGYSSTNC